MLLLREQKLEMAGKKQHRDFRISSDSAVQKGHGNMKLCAVGTEEIIRDDGKQKRNRKSEDQE